MKITMFAAIYIGSYEVDLKIFELSPRKKIRCIEHIRKRMELGRDAYAKGTIGYELVEDLCQLLKEFYYIMEGYQVEAYRAYASMVIRDASNELFILDQIRLRTKIDVQVLSNSEQRFISYKSLTANGHFAHMAEDGAALADVGGGSIQITLFLKGNVITTQHIVLGTMRIREKLSAMDSLASHYEMQIQELIDKELEIFRNLYLKGKEIKYVIMVGNYIKEIMKNVSRQEDDTIEITRFFKTLNKFSKKKPEIMLEDLCFSNEFDSLLIPSVIFYRRLAEELNADYIWIPGANISDGMAYDYAQQNGIIKAEHDFDEDVLSMAKNLAQRYKGFTMHSESLLIITEAIYDAIKKVHGMGNRERLLLQAATILHDCGRYVSLANQAECSYQIIMASEIIGMTHLEREIVASTVKYNSYPLAPYEEMMDKMNQGSYIAVAKLSAILKLANALDRSHKQKFKNIRAVLKGKQLIITAETKENVLLEKGLFAAYADYFEKIFSVEPIIKERFVLN